MLDFFVKHKKERGVITIFLTIIYLAVYLMIGVFVDGGRVRMAESILEDVQQIATENVMSQYNRGLYEYYGLLGLNEELDDITKDVKAQIEESLGFKVPEDTVRTFIEDVWVGGNSAVENFGIFKSTNSIISKVKEYSSNIKSDIADYHKRFDPYGLEIISATASYIDLTNTEALRAQIRDEMRYSAPLVLAANFSDVAEKFLNVSGSADAIKDVTDKITTKGEDIEKKQKEYYDSIDDFATKFDKFVEKSYKKEGICKKVESAYENIKEKINNVVKDIAKNVVNSIYNWLFKKNDNTENNQNIDNNISDEEKNPATNMAGYENVVVSENLVLKDYVVEFDEDTWPDGDEFVDEEVTGVDDEGNVETDDFYHGVCSNCGNNYQHDDEVRKITNDKYDNYHNNIDELLELCNNAFDQADLTIKLVEEVMVMINKLEGELKREYDKNVGNDDVQMIYNTSMETYVRQWNKLYDEKEALENFKNKLEKIKTLIEKADSTAKEKADKINKLTTEHRLYESWGSPYTDSNITTLLNEQNSILAEYDKILTDLKNDEKGIKNFTIHSENEGLKADVFKLLNYVVKKKKDDNVDVNNDDRTFGKIKVSKKSDNSVYDPSEGLVEDDMNDDNIIKKINAIFEKATQIIEAIPTELVNNIYDETYILTHCRDYVHTYRYRNLDDKDKNDEDLDTILNPKFVKDQHETKYLTNTQFKEIEQTPAEIEYILWGLGDDEDGFDTGANIAIMYANIFIIRLALNYIAALTSPHCVKEATALAAACGPFAPAVRFAAPLIYALPKSITDTKEIMFECKKVQFYNGSKDLHLWNAVTDLVEKAKDDATETMNEMLNNMKAKGSELLKNNQLGTSLICAEVISKAKSEKYVKVHDVAIHLGGLRFFDEKSVCLDSSSISEEVKKEDKSVKAGYSDYLLIYLFLRGIKKESQIANLRNVIETNMRKAQSDDFRLSKTFSQIGVETNCSVKFIFMTQAAMTKTFSNSKNYNKFITRIKTSFAY